jgi:hypothetical protein
MLHINTYSLYLKIQAVLTFLRFIEFMHRYIMSRYMVKYMNLENPK